MYRQCPTHHVGKYAIILFDRCTLNQFSLHLSIAAGIGQDIDLNVSLFFFLLGTERRYYHPPAQQTYPVCGLSSNSSR